MRKKYNIYDMSQTYEIGCTSLFYYFDGLLNTNISQSMHPCGMVVSPVTLEDNYGTLYKDDKKILKESDKA